MARYGMDYGRNPDRWGGMNRGYGGGMGGQGGGYGGMRSDGWGSDYRDFPGEEGWFGQGMEGYPAGGYGGGYGGGYDMGYQGATREDWGTRVGGGRNPRGMNAGRGGFGAGEPGGYGGIGRGGGYAGRNVGYGTRDIGERGGGWGGGEQGGQRSRMRASELMTEDPQAVTPDATLTEVAKRMKELNVGIIPVVESQESRRLRGVITDRDITIRAVAEGKDGKAKVSDCMTSDVETVNKNDSVEQVMNVMQREQVRRVPVTDREGRLVGIIAQADLAVDYGEDSARRERMVENTIERISEPAQPRRGGSAMQAGGRAAGGRQGSARNTASQGNLAQESGQTEKKQR